MKEIVLITRTVTGNQGNQALSVAWRDFLKDCFPSAPIRLLERAPKYLRQYSVGQFCNASNPRAAFDAAVRKLIDKADLPATLPAASQAVKYAPEMAGVVRFQSLRNKVRLRGVLSSMGLGKKRFDERLAIMKAAGCVVLNPAGEFNPKSVDLALSYLLDIRCAQLLGIKTAIVNLSFEVEDPCVLDLAAHVFDQCDLLEFREEQSLETFRRAGGRKDPIILPDGAILTPPANKSGDPAKPARVAIILNSLQIDDAGLTDDTLALLGRLTSAGHQLVLTSNEWATDIPFWSALVNGDSVAIEGQGLDHDDYMSFLGAFDIVISNRLHTCVLAIIADTAIIPMEIGTFKLTGFFTQIGLEGLAIRMGSAGWQDRVLESIDDIRNDRAGAIARQSACRDAAIARLRADLVPAFQRLMAI